MFISSVQRVPDPADACAGLIAARPQIRCADSTFG
jgi:hypothetical protein